MVINNKFGCTVIGRIARDPEQKTFDSGKSKVNFSVIYGRDLEGERDEHGRLPSLFMNIDVWSEYGENCMWLQKGDNVAVTGRIDKREHEGKTYVTLVADSVIPDAPSIYRMIGKMAINVATADEAPSFSDIPELDDGDLPF